MVRPCPWQDTRHVGTLPKEVHGHNRFDTGRECRIELLRVEVAGKGVNVDENWGEPQEEHHLGSGCVGKGGDNHLVASTQTARHQGYLQRIRAVTTGDDLHGLPFGGVHMRPELGGKEGDLLPLDEVPVGEHLCHSGLYFW